MNSVPHPALVNVPKSPLEAYERLLKALEKDELQPSGICKYSNSDDEPCAVGYFFTPEQRADIKGRGDLNDESIFDVSLVIGVKNVEAMTGMTIDQCVSVQRAFDHDSGYRSFKVFLEQGIALLKRAN